MLKALSPKNKRFATKSSKADEPHLQLHAKNANRNNITEAKHEQPITTLPRPKKHNVLFVIFRKMRASEHLTPSFKSTPGNLNQRERSELLNSSNPPLQR
ncbi:MAG: hypothetical protein LBL41_00530, partial [Bifidobacteriaceae bacterium]|nr:hypothetical protein [Bifidobacteriaceae bacterium]